MRYLFSSMVGLSVGLAALVAVADHDDKGDKAPKKDDGGPRAEMRERIFKEFDKDGDGKLSDEEREKAREKMQELRRKFAPGEHGPGPGGPGARPHLPKPEEMFSKFDEDKDEKLSKEEFMKLTHFVREHMPMPPGPPPGGPRFAGRGPGGPGEGRFERRGPGGPGEGRFEGRGPDGPREGRFEGRGGEHRRFDEGDGPGRHFRGGPDGPPPPRRGEGDEGPRFRRGPGGPPDGEFGPRGRGFERDGHRGPPRDRDRDRDDDGDDDGDGQGPGSDKGHDKDHQKESVA